VIINVKVYHYEVFGEGSMKLNLENNATVKDVLDILGGRFGESFEEKTGKKFEDELQNTLAVFLNGTRIFVPYDKGHRLRNGDELVILRPVGGG
jgi:sulfur carrier protein ThiS